MMTFSQHARLETVETKPWSGLLNYFRTMKAEWDALEALGYVTPRLMPPTTHYGTEVWEYTITEAGRVALADSRNLILDKARHI